jgi:hypothetical protein
LETRLTTAKDNLHAQQVSLLSTDPGLVRSALDICAQYGIPEALVEIEDDTNILERAKIVSAIVDKRVATASVSASDGFESLSAAARALFGESFLLSPTLDLSSLAAAGNIADFEVDTVLQPPPPDRIWLWFQQVAETHPRVRRFETALMLMEAWGGLRGNSSFSGLKVAQLFAREGAAVDASVLEPLHGWQALSNAELATSERPRGATSIVAMLPAVVTMEGISGFVIDEWTETMAAPEVATGISFEYNQPACQAPHCFLLAVPGNFEADDGVWTARHLAEIVRDTMDLAKARLVDLDALPAVAGIFPALFFPIRPSKAERITPQPNPLGARSPGYEHRTPSHA